MPCRALVLGLPKKQRREKKQNIGEQKTGKEICYHIFTDLDMSFDSLASNFKSITVVVKALCLREHEL